MPVSVLSDMKNYFIKNMNFYEKLYFAKCEMYKRFLNKGVDYKMKYNDIENFIS